MAKNAPAKDTEPAEEGAGEPARFSAEDKSRAQQWFAKAKDLRERRDYGYAIQCYINGLDFWTEAVEDGHMPLWSLAIQRQQAGGKKPGMMEGLKHPMTGKDPKRCLLNAEHLMAKDPTNSGYLDGVLKNANRADLPETLKWIAPKVLDSMRKDKKVNVGRFKTFRQVLVEAGERADEQGDPHRVAWCYEQAVNAIDHLIARNPTDMALKDEQRDLSGRLTIARGKYGDADSFRESLQDADQQKLLHDAERAKQSQQSLEALIAAEREEYEKNPTVPGKIHAYVEALLKPERRKEELLAIDVLTKAFQQSSNYSFKQKADDVRLKQLARQSRRWKEKAQLSGKDGDKQQHRLAAMEERQTRLEIYRERVGKYPTDLRLKYRLGDALFRDEQYDQAIPVLQEAQDEPRYRVKSRILLGRSFFEKEAFSQAADVLSEALEKQQITTDDDSKMMMYWLGRAYEADGKIDEAKTTYGKLLRQDYNYAKGDARRRHEGLG